MNCLSARDDRKKIYASKVFRALKALIKRKMLNSKRYQSSKIQFNCDYPFLVEKILSSKLHKYYIF